MAAQVAQSMGEIAGVFLTKTVLEERTQFGFADGRRSSPKFKNRVRKGAARTIATPIEQVILTYARLFKHRFARESLGRRMKRHERSNLCVS